MTVEGAKNVTLTQKEFDGVMHYYAYVQTAAENKNSNPYRSVTVEGTLSFQDAYQRAKSMKFNGLQGYLVTITSEEENTILDQITEWKGWGGGGRVTQADASKNYDYFTTDGSSDGTLIGQSNDTTWYWVDGPDAGSTFTFTKWNSGEPNGYTNNSGEYLLVIHDNNGCWNDNPPDTYLQPGFFVEFSEDTRTVESLTTTVNAAYTGPHSHCVCGKDNCADHGGVQTWTAWTSTNSLPTTAGYYYLTNDVAVSGATSPATGVYLCLNGHDITNSATSSVIKLGNNVTFTLTDCCTDTVRYATDPNGDGVYETVVSEEPSSGKYFAITGGAFIGGTSYDTGVLFASGSGSVLNMYGGCIVGHYDNHIAGAVGVMNGTFNMYGGIIGGCRNSQREAAIYNWYGTTNIYGGTMCNNVTATFAENARTNIYGGTFTGHTGRVFSGWSTINIYGGTITQNTAADWLTNSVAIMTGGSFIDNTLTATGVGAVPAITTIGGDAVVDNNMNTVDNCEYNVRLDTGKTMAVATGDSAPREGMNVGVYSITLPTAGSPVPVTSNSGDSYVYFSSDRAGYEVSKNAGDYVELANPVVYQAKVVDKDGEETLYELLTDAAANAPEGSTIYLLQDVDLSSSPKHPLQIGKSLTLDLNEHKLSGYDVVDATNGATVRVTNGTIYSGTNSSCVGVTGDSGTLYVDHVKLTGFNAFYAEKATTHTYLGEGVTTENLSSLYSTDGGGILHITDGVYNVTKLEAYNRSLASEKIFITGGCFYYSNVASTLKNYVANGYSAVSCTHGRSGYYDVVLNEDKAKVELTHIDSTGKKAVTKFASLQDAINASAEGDVIQLLADVTENATVASGKDVVIDLNGKTATAKDSTHPVITNQGTLILTDSVGGGDLTGGCYGVQQSGTLSVGGKLNLTGDDDASVNVYLSTGKTVDPATGDYAPDGMKVGVTTEVLPEKDAPVNITSVTTTDVSEYFTSDNTAYEVFYENQQVKLKISDHYTITFLPNGANNKVDGEKFISKSVQVTRGDESCIAEFPVITREGCVLAGWTDVSGGGEVKYSTEELIKLEGITSTFIYPVWGIEVGVPIYVSLTEDSELPDDSDRQYSFKLESLTDSAPMPTETTIELDAPTDVGVNNKVGYAPEDENNPWKMTFTKGTYQYVLTQTSETLEGETLDYGKWVLEMDILPGDSDKLYEIRWARYDGQVADLSETSFDIAKVTDARAVVTTDGGKISVVLGGNTVLSGDGFNTAVIKGKFEIDFSKNFQLVGTLKTPPAATPDGCCIGFMPYSGTISSSELIGGGNLGYISNKKFAKSIVLDFDPYDNGSSYGDPGYPHISLTTTSATGWPVVVKHQSVGYRWPTGLCSYVISNDADNKVLTFNITLTNGDVLTYTYNDPVKLFGTNIAYYFMSGVIRRGAAGSWGLGSAGSTAPSLTMNFDTFYYQGTAKDFDTESCVFKNKISYVASVDDGTTVKKYGSLQSAIDAAGSGDEIQLLTDVTENVTVPAGTEVVIDLKGNTVKAEESTEPVITNKGDLTLTDSVGGGKLTGGSYGVEQDGELSVGGKLDLTGDDNTNGNIYLPDGQTVNPADGEYAPDSSMQVGVTTEKKPSGKDSVLITDSSETDISGYFTSDTEEYSIGDVVIDGKHYVALGTNQIVMISTSASKVYNGTPLTNGTTPVIVTGEILEGDGFDYTFNGSVTNVGLSTNDFTYTPKADNRTEYVVTQKFGVLTVNPYAGDAQRPDIDDLQGLFEDLIVKNPGTHVAVWMEISQDVPQEDIDAFQPYLGEEAESIFYQATLWQEIGEAEAEDIGDSNDVAIGVTCDFDFGGTKEVHVYRLHGGDVSELTTYGTDGEFIVLDETSGQIIVKAKKYSTFCITWENKSTPSTGDNTHLWLYLAIATLSLVGAVSLIVIRRKRRG